MFQTVANPLSVLVLVLITCFAGDVWGRGPDGRGSDSRPPFGGRRSGGLSYSPSTHDNCHRVVSLNATEFANFTAATTLCVANQTGLQTLLYNITNLCYGGGPGGHRSRGRRNDGHHGFRSIDPAALLAALGNTTDAVLYMMCMANSTGLMDSSGNFNMTALNARITYKVTAYPEVAANTQLGITNCPTVTNYNVTAYMNCIWSSCETGAAPSG